ncbi:STAS domain-containing protein [Nonomuraea rubra]
MQTDIGVHDAYITFTVRGALDHLAACDLQDQIDMLIARHGRLPCLLLDVSDVTRATQQAAHAFAVLLRHQRAGRAGPMVVVGLHGPLLRILQRAGLHTYLTERRSRAEATKLLLAEPACRDRDAAR